MATLRVSARPTPAERDDDRIEVEVKGDLTMLAATLEDWAAAHPEWELVLREGHRFGRLNNVEANLLFVEGPQTSSLRFRPERVEAAGEELALLFEERDGIAKLARLTPN
jgi:hypothetical protein